MLAHGRRDGGQRHERAAALQARGVHEAPQVADASPAAHIDARDPPFLLIHGETDAVVPVAQSRDVEKAFRTAGVRGGIHLHPGRRPQLHRRDARGNTRRNP